MNIVVDKVIRLMDVLVFEDKTVTHRRTSPGLALLMDRRGYLNNL